ncbi:hypothetical protein [Sinomonas sp. RB5]
MDTALMTTFFVAVLAANAMIVFTYLLYRHPELGAVLCGVTVLTAWELPSPQPLATLAGNSVYLQDVASLIFLVVAFPGIGRIHARLKLSSLLWFAFALSILFSFLSGIDVNRLGNATNESRPFFYTISAMLWAMSLKWSKDQERRLLIQASLLIGWGLVLVALYHMSLYGLGSTDTYVDPGTGMEQTTRCLVSGQALTLLFCAVSLLWAFRATRNRVHLLSSMAFFTIVLASEQRTVWAVAAGVMLVAFITSRKKLKLTIVLFALVATATLIAVTTSSVVAGILDRLDAAASNSGTYDARVTSWTALVDQNVALGFWTISFGQPMGAGFGRFEGEGRWVEFAPHNWYVTVFLRAGVTGLVLLLLFLAAVLVRTRGATTSQLAWAIIIGLTLYGWAYSWPWYVCIFWGWAIAQCRDSLLGHGALEADSLHRAAWFPKTKNYIEERQR